MHLLSVIPEWFYQESKQWEGTRPIVPNRRTKGKKQKRGFPIKDFGNDG
jgi:hypothetical protein